jgi:hypothetical protein
LRERVATLLGPNKMATFPATITPAMVCGSRTAWCRARLRCPEHAGRPASSLRATLLVASFSMLVPDRAVHCMPAIMSAVTETRWREGTAGPGSLHGLLSSSPLCAMWRPSVATGPQCRGSGLENRFCAECLAEGSMALATQVDHVIQISERPDLRLEPTNLQAPLRNSSRAQGACRAVRHRAIGIPSGAARRVLRSLRDSEGTREAGGRGSKSPKRKAPVTTR